MSVQRPVMVVRATATEPAETENACAIATSKEHSANLRAKKNERHRGSRLYTYSCRS